MEWWNSGSFLTVILCGRWNQKVSAFSVDMKAFVELSLSGDEGLTLQAACNTHVFNNLLYKIMDDVHTLLFFGVLVEGLGQ